jgi:hypothetical protein
MPENQGQIHTSHQNGAGSNPTAAASGSGEQTRKQADSITRRQQKGKSNDEPVAPDVAANAPNVNLSRSSTAPAKKGNSSNQ